MDGQAAAYSKSERVVLGRAFAVPPAAERPCPPGTAASRRRLLFPVRPLAFPALTLCHTPASAPSLCPRAPPPSSVCGRGEASAITPLLWLQVHRKAGEEGCWDTQSHKLLPSHTPCCCSLPSLPSGHQFQYPVETLGDFSACLGQGEAFVVASR